MVPQVVRDTRVTCIFVNVKNWKSTSYRMTYFYCRYDEAQVIWEDCLQEKEKEVGEDSPELSPILLGLASALSGAEKFKQAESILLRSLKLSAAQYGPDAPQTSVPMEELASVLHHLDKDDEAELLAQQVLRIRESASGPLHPSTGK